MKKIVKREPSSNAGTTGNATKTGVVLGIDIANASRLSVAEHVDASNALTHIIKESSTMDVALSENRVIVFPRGDGFLLVFFEDLEAPLRLADEIASRARTDSRLQIRMALHMGLLVVTEGLNGAPSVLGEAINSAALLTGSNNDDGEILLTRPVQEIAAKMPEFRSRLLRKGMITYKSGLEIEAFALTEAAQSANTGAAGTAIEALLSGARLGILTILFRDPNQEWFLSDLSGELGVAPSSLQRELTHLVSSGILESRKDAGRVYYRTAQSSPIFHELGQLIQRHPKAKG